MTVSGDLATIDLADLLQNIEGHSRTGTLTLLSDAGEARLFFRDGRVALLARDGRTAFVDMLVATGHVTQRRLDGARKKQKGTGRAIVDLLTGARVCTEDDLRALAEHRLGEDVANLIAAADGEFRFVEGEPADDAFDPDEARLGCALAVAPLVLEATRRVDDWAEIRKYLPSLTVHLRARDGATPPADVEQADVAAALLQALDGSRSAAEVIEAAPDEPFTASKLLARFVRDRLVRPVTCDELLAIAEQHEPQAPERAQVLVQRGLDGEPHHTGLLEAAARLAERLRQAVAAGDAHKLLAHLHLEAGRPDAALAALDAAKRLQPTDPSLWQRSLQLAMAKGDREAALRDGMQLVELYRGPGLHARARTVLDRLLTIAPDVHDLHVEFARACVDCGSPEAGVQHLARQAKTLVGQANYLAARSLWCELLEIAPGNQEATLSIELIDREEFARQSERRRRLRRTAVTTLLLATAGFFFTCELLGRAAWSAANSLISRERMIERSQYEDALVVLRRARSEHPLAATSWFELPAAIHELEQRLAERDTWPGSGR